MVSENKCNMLYLRVKVFNLSLNYDYPIATPLSSVCCSEIKNVDLELKEVFLTLRTHVLK